MTRSMTAIFGLSALALLAGCDRDADVASRNISRAADQFEVTRRIVFFNGITDKYLMEVIGRCALGNYDSGRRMSVTCKVGEGKYKKHYLGLSDNVSFFAEQLETIDVSVYHYRVIFKPQAIVPEINLKGSLKELTKSKH